MRNILVFPDGTKQSFMYPENRDIDVGERLEVTLEDENVHVLEVSDIQKTEKEILYYLSHV